MVPANQQIDWAVELAEDRPFAFQGSVLRFGTRQSSQQTIRMTGPFEHSFPAPCTHYNTIQYLYILLQLSTVCAIVACAFRKRYAMAYPRPFSAPRTPAESPQSPNSSRINTSAQP